jgi:anti-sigma factor RsiW
METLALRLDRVEREREGKRGREGGVNRLPKQLPRWFRHMLGLAGFLLIASARRGWAMPVATNREGFKRRPFNNRLNSP